MRKVNAAIVSCVVLLAGAGALGAQILDRPAPTPAPPREPRPVIYKGQGDNPNAVVESQTMPPPGGPLAAQKPDPLKAGRPASQDGATVDSAIAALYESVSHPEETEPDWARMRDLFLPVGMLIPPKPARDDIFTVLDVDGFQDRVAQGRGGREAEGRSHGLLREGDRAQARLLRQRLPGLLDLRSAAVAGRREAVRPGDQQHPARARRTALVGRLGRLGHRASGQPDPARLPGRAREVAQLRVSAPAGRAPASAPWPPRRRPSGSRAGGCAPGCGARRSPCLRAT